MVSLFSSRQHTLHTEQEALFSEYTASKKRQPCSALVVEWINMRVSNWL